jgi:hypothetical protein
MKKQEKTGKTGSYSAEGHGPRCAALHDATSAFDFSRLVESGLVYGPLLDFLLAGA